MTETGEIVHSISEAINICDRYGHYGIGDELYEIISNITNESESEGDSMTNTSVTINPFYTVIGIKIDVFESTIDRERHFKIKEHAEEYADNLRRETGMIVIVASV